MTESRMLDVWYTRMKEKGLKNAGFLRSMWLVYLWQELSIIKEDKRQKINEERIL